MQSNKQLDQTKKRQSVPEHQVNQKRYSNKFYEV